jgi:hypothetical protein
MIYEVGLWLYNRLFRRIYAYALHIETARLGSGAGCRHTLHELAQPLHLATDIVNRYAI